jgi:hypothetical protein
LCTRCKKVVPIHTGTGSNEHADIMSLNVTD